MIFPFDHYQRYKTAQLAVLELKALHGKQPLRILEVGANEHRNLEKLLPEDQITYLDIQLPDELKNNPQFIQGDATDMRQFADNAFDVVVGLDILEHIPADKRRAFFSETARVAKYGAVISAPNGIPETAAAEARADEAFRILYGQEYIWLKEHHERGLPAPEETDETLRALGLSSFCFAHGSLDVWEKMMRLHFLIEAMPEFSRYRELIDSYYDENVYANDVGGLCYRRFYVVARETAGPDAVARRFGEFFGREKVGEQTAYLDSLLHSINTLASVLFFVRNQGVKDELNTLTADVASLLSQNGALAGLSGRLQESISRLSSIANLEAKLAGLQHDFAVQQQNMVILQQRYNDVVYSKSWKITRPLRLATTFLQRKKKSGAAPVIPEYNLSVKPPLHLVVLSPVPPKALRETLQSLLSQGYEEMTVSVIDASQSDDEAAVCEQAVLSFSDDRLRYKRVEHNTPLKETNAYLAAEAENLRDGYFLFLAPGVSLLPNALKELVSAINNTHADALYADEKLQGAGGALNSRLYPGWSPDLLNAQMYLNNLLAMRVETFLELGGFDDEAQSAAIYSLALRLQSRRVEVFHIPAFAARLRKPDDDDGEKAAGLAALNRHLHSFGGAHASLGEDGFFDTRFEQKKSTKVSIIIPTKDGVALLDNCVKSIVEKTTWKNYEIIILDNNSTEPETFRWFEHAQSTIPGLRVIKAAFPFNWSRLNNFGMAHADGDVFVFLNNDTVIISPDWLERLAENAMREEIGVVGGLLLYEDGTIQHAGVVVGMCDWADHIYKGCAVSMPEGVFVPPAASRNVLAVTGALMAVSRETIEKIGGFNETFEICGSDIEICIRAYKAGLFNLYDSAVRLYHLESKTRSPEVPEIDYIMSAQSYCPYRETGDPFFHAKLDKRSYIPIERG